MNISLTLFLTFALLASCLVSHTLAACNVCGSVSGVACLNSTAYNLCDSNGVPTGLVSNCPDGYYCTRLGVKCIDDITYVDCPDAVESPGCGCSDEVIACTSRNTFVVCDADGVATSQTGSCPDGYVCNTNPTPKKICVSDQCTLPTCDRDAVA